MITFVSATSFSPAPQDNIQESEAHGKSVKNVQMVDGDC